MAATVAKTFHVSNDSPSEFPSSQEPLQALGDDNKKWYMWFEHRHVFDNNGFWANYCFGSGRMRRRRNWRSWHHLKHLAAKSTMKTMDRCERQQGHPFPDRRPMTWNQSWKRRKMSTKSWSLGSEGELVCALFAVDCFWDYRWKDQWADPATWHVVFEAMRTLVKEDNKSFSKMWLTDDSDSYLASFFGYTLSVSLV